MPMPKWKKITPEQAARFDAALPGGVERRQMFGCPIAVVNGNMFAGVHNDEINVRLSETDREKFLGSFEGARVFSPMKGMEMKEYVVFPQAIATQPTVLARWLRRGFDYASALPPKVKKAAAAKRSPGAKARPKARSAR